MTRNFLLKISTRSFQAAGVILLTVAGGAYKQILVNTGSGEMIAEALNNSFFNPLIFGFTVAALIRILQGSSTVAMITAAGITAPVLAGAVFSPAQVALMVIAIASGASILSHVNDSGFWLVGQYLGLTEKQTFKSWTVMTTLIALTGLVSSLCFWYLI